MHFKEGGYKMKRFFHKSLMMGLVFIMIASLLIGCSNQSQSTSDTKEPTQPTTEGSTTGESEESNETAKDDTSGKKVTLTLLMGNTGNRDGLNAVIKKIEEKLNIATEVELRPGGAEGENIIRTRLAVGESTDMHIFNSGALLGTLNPTKNFVDVTDQPYMDKIIDDFKKTVTFDGKIYGIPSQPYGNAGGWLYNKKVYEELGLEVPKTWNDLMKNCEKIKEAGKIPVIGSFATDWTSQLILLADYYNIQAVQPDFAEKFNKNQAKYATTPAAFRAFEKMSEVYERGFLNDDAYATTLDMALKMLVDGEGAHYPMLTVQVSNIASNFGEEAVNNIGFFAQPGDDPNNVGLTVWIPDTLLIYKESPNVDAALKWFEYFVSEEAVQIYSEHRPPTGPYVIKGIELGENVYAPIRDAVKYVEEGKTAPALEFITSVKGPNSPQICIQALSGQKSAKECAEEYDRDVEKQAKQLGLEGW